jgi:hypothetical protein
MNNGISGRNLLKNYIKNLNRRKQRPKIIQNIDYNTNAADYYSFLQWRERSTDDNFSYDGYKRKEKMIEVK